MASTPQDEFRSLMGFLESDPANAALLEDAANAAVQAGELETAKMLFERLHDVAPLNGERANAAGLAAMRSGYQAIAQTWFGLVLEDAPDDSGVRFNLAWSHALDGDFAAAADFLDAKVIAELPQAAMLDLQIAHHLGDFEAAGRKMDRYLEQFPDYAPLNAAASVLAMDIDRPDLAREAAIKAGDHPDALTTLAALSLGENNLSEAEEMLAKARAIRADQPRAEIGQGMLMLAKGDPEGATALLDRGAELFGDHLGSWVAAGWAHLMAGDRQPARKRFETACQIDGTFGEAQGSLAVIEFLDGNVDEARKMAKVATRLDPASFSAALTNVLIAQSDGKPELAERILSKAFKQPILPDGTNLLQALARSVSSK